MSKKLSLSSRLHVIHPKQLLAKDVSSFDSGMVNYMAKTLGSVGFIWFCILLDLFGLFGLIVATLTVATTSISPLHVSGTIISAVFLKICTIFVLWVTFVAQAVIQLIALPVLQNYANRQQAQNDAKADADHQNMVMLVQLQQEQMAELKNQGEILNALKPKK